MRLELLCAGCLGFRFGAGPVLDTNGGAGAGASLVVSADITGKRDAIEIASGGGGALTTREAHATLETGVDYRAPVGGPMAFRVGVFGRFHGQNEGPSNGIGARFGIPIAFAKNEAALFGSGDKSWGRSGGFWCVGPELDAEYIFAEKQIPESAMLSVHLVVEGHSWIRFY